MPAPEEERRQVIRRRASSPRRVRSRHHGAIGLRESRSTPEPATPRHRDAVPGRPRRAGLSLAPTAHALTVLDSYVYGFALQEKAPRFTADGSTEPGCAYGDAFAFGPDPVLGGLRRRAVDRAEGGRGRLPGRRDGEPGGGGAGSREGAGCGRADRAGAGAGWGVSVG